MFVLFLVDVSSGEGSFLRANDPNRNLDEETSDRDLFLGGGALKNAVAAVANTVRLGGATPPTTASPPNGGPGNPLERIQVSSTTPGKGNNCFCGEKPIVIDFRLFRRGQYLRTILLNRLYVSARGDSPAFTPNSAARIFDTARPSASTHLGSPNQACGGPGVGDAGAPERTTANCTPQGNVLIIQRLRRRVPRDSNRNGSFRFQIDSRVNWRLSAVGILGASGQIELSTTNKLDGTVATSRFAGPGPNGFLHMLVSHPVRFYSEFTITLPQGGGISYLVFCEWEQEPGVVAAAGLTDVVRLDGA